MTSIQMGNKILEFIEKNGDASFVNIMRILGDEAKGDLCPQILPNVILWADMSKTAMEAIEWLKKQKSIEPRSCSRLIYMIDGWDLNLPIAKRPRKQGYKTLHWLPILFTKKRAK